jgi:oxaloacetate decarboxylase alpha subunit
MEFLSNKPLLITDTILRDAHQSQAATRMTLEQMLPACEILDSIGYYSLECWGGATFDACLRFLDEDPWERLASCAPTCRTRSSRCSSAARTS